MDLVEAARRGDIHRVQELLPGATFDTKNRALEKAAAYYGHIEIVEMLLNAGADPNRSYVLILATVFGHTQIVELLLDAGANRNREEALREAAKNGHIQIIVLLLAAGANIGNLSKVHQEKFKHLVPTYISIQEYLIIESLIINIMELKNRYIVDVVPNKKYIVLK